MDEIEFSMNEDPKDLLPFSVSCSTDQPQQFPVYVLTGWIGWYHILTSVSATPNSLISMIRTQKGVTAGQKQLFFKYISPFYFLLHDTQLVREDQGR